jgi:hypothetical protein
MATDLFAGHEPRECGEHRTTGERAWCYSCSEWCYPEAGCKGCHVPLLEARIARALALIAEQDGNEICPVFAANLTRLLSGPAETRSEPPEPTDVPLPAGSTEPGGALPENTYRKRIKEMTEETQAPTPAELLDLPLPPNDSGAGTVRGYLVKLLASVWEEGEGFSGKRPFGNSGWQSDFYPALISAGIIEGTLDEDGWLDDVPRASEEKAAALILAAIRSLDPAGK